MGRTPGAFRGQRSLADVFTESGENGVPLPSLHPQYFHRSPCGHRAQKPASRASGQQTVGVCASWREPCAQPHLPTGTPSCSCPAPRSPSVRPGPHPRRWQPPLNPHTPTGQGSPEWSPQGSSCRHSLAAPRSRLSSFGVQLKRYLFQGTFSGHPPNTAPPSTPPRSIVTAISCWQGSPGITASTVASAESRSSVTTCRRNSLNTQDVSLLHCISCHFKKIQHNFYFLKNEYG